MEIPGPTELAFLRFKGKWLFSVMGSQNQRGTEANSNARAPSLAHSQNWEIAGQLDLATSSLLGTAAKLYLVP